MPLENTGSKMSRINFRNSNSMAKFNFNNSNKNEKQKPLAFLNDKADNFL